MKTFKLVIFFFLYILAIGCNNSVELYDFERYKFVSFIDAEVTVSETYTAENGSDYPIYLRYDGSVLEEDFSVNLKVTGNNASEGTDYSVNSTEVIFKAGEIKSEPFNLTLIDDLLNSEEDRSLEITIESVSLPNVDIGVGIVNQSNKSIIVNILDNECSETVDIFNSSNIVNSSGGHIVTGTVNGSVVSLTGNLINYGPFPNANLEITLTPTVDGGSSGAATFSDFDAGTDNGGYVYQFRQNGEGTYDVCSGEISVSIDVYYESGGSWVFWYTSTSIFSIGE
ncbi:Calx-beta domain-containing protein [Aureibaculum sp. 2210JD6-5]|uniref:Calx-beta domain-containing protein n=1 Tax=Aureibaculum sp. 2210JD6-5 TaxID=3103957 RepID=UPI002AACD32A|nr:Calx-beta domain-containing protein [Aureibaculum sp. 2210JD6-5]MDY7395150.1 Calx-beta domain-containing protein [Aureibaculum sp. 2210JD6-5]